LSTESATERFDVVGGDSGSVLATCYSVVLLARYYADIGQIAISLGIIKAITDDEFIWDCEANVIALQRQFAAGRLVEESSNLKRSRLVRQ
jgi:hypothetical protein